MKKVILTLIMLSSTAWGTTTGSYSGQGRWQDSQGGSGTYQVRTTIAADLVTSEYDFAGRIEKVESRIVRSRPDAAAFEIFNGATKVGEGYCMSVQCHVELEVDGVKVEETSTFYEGQLYKIGSKLVNGTRVTWEEALN